MSKASWRVKLADLLLEDDDPEEPFYDPVHLGGTLLVTLIAVGCLYWLLWTLLVYEGGIFLKLRALGLLVLGGRSLKDLGWEGYPYAMGEFEGIVGVAGALLISVAVVEALRRLYRSAEARHRKA